MRLVGLWTRPEDVDAFEREYLGSHLPKVEALPGNAGVRSSRCIDGPFFRLTEVEFASLDQIHASLESDHGRRVMDDAQALATKFGVRLDVLVVADPDAGAALGPAPGGGVLGLLSTDAGPHDLARAVRMIASCRARRPVALAPALPTPT